MKIFKNKYFWIILGILAIVFLLGWWFNNRQAKSPEYVTAQVKRGNLVQTVSATGKVESASATKLNFKQSGVLSQVYVSAGDQVKAGQLLASLSAGQSLSAVTAARAQAAQAEADLASLQAGSSQEEIEVAEAKVIQSKTDLAAITATAGKILKENEQNLISLKEQALNKTSESLFLIKSSLKDVDQIINNLSYRSDLQVLNFLYDAALSSYNATALKQVSLAKAKEGYTIASRESELIVLLDQTDAALKELDQLLDDSFELFSRSPVGATVTQTLLNSFKTTVTTAQTSLAVKIVAVQTAKSNLQTKVVEYQNSASAAADNVTKAQAALKVAEAELALTKAGPRNFQVSLYQAKVDQAKANLEKALSDLSDFSLKSPVDGLITKVNYEVGELVNVTEEIFSLIGESNLEIEVDVPESDISKIKVGDSAQITLDAFGDERVFMSHVTFIDPAETVINDVVYYKVKVTFDQKEEGVKSGMTANVVVTTASRDQALFIPQRAVIEKGKLRLVKVLPESGLVAEKEVTTGLRADEGMIEVLSGLTEGETVVTFIKEKK